VSNRAFSIGKLPFGGRHAIGLIGAGDLVADRRAIRPAARASDDRPMTSCHFCDEDIADAVAICGRCQNIVDPAQLWLQAGGAAIRLGVSVGALLLLAYLLLAFGRTFNQ
jgi:hypothetical protein